MNGSNGWHWAKCLVLLGFPWAYLRLFQWVQDCANRHAFDWPISWYFLLPAALYVGMGLFLYGLCSRDVSRLQRGPWRMEIGTVLVATVALWALTLCFPFTSALFRRLPGIGLLALFAAVYTCRLVALWRGRKQVDGSAAQTDAQA